MKTNFPSELLNDADMQTSEAVIRKCVHCGFCTATCPTYTLLGDELDSPRGRIYLIKEMLENQRKPTRQDVKHIDRCLSCLSCMSTCPSDVNYMHLVDHARRYIEDHYERPLLDRIYRAVLATILPYERRFRGAMMLGWPAKFLAPLFAKFKPLAPLAALLDLIPGRLPARTKTEEAKPGATKGRVALLPGCAEPAIRPDYRAATVRLLQRMGFEPVLPQDSGCCGAMTHHLGREQQTLHLAKSMIDAWYDEFQDKGLDAIVITASGCGTTIKDYGFMLKDDPDYAEKAERVSALAMDITEFVSLHGLPKLKSGLPNSRVAYHSACSMQHGQQIKTEPVELLQAAGFDVIQPQESHLCCGSAGVYNVLQPKLATQLGKRKSENLQALQPDLIATGNVGCAVQIRRYNDTPICHTVELLDWATGGPLPSPLKPTLESTS